MKLYGNVRHSVTGPMTAGTLERFDAGVAINAVTATAPGTAINHLRAGRAITGDITATSGDINLIAVRNNTDPLNASAAVGIQGNISAPAGRINQIYTMGPIGTETGGVVSRKNITALNGVRFLRAVDVNGVNTDDPAGGSGAALLAVPFRANIRTLSEDAAAGQPEDDRPTLRIDTAGDYDGDIVVQNLVASQYTGPVGAAKDWGIHVGGTITGDVLVRDQVRIASIVAGAFAGEVRVNTKLKGSVVARAGSIPSITVGRAPWSGSAASAEPGFTGSICRPADRLLLDDPSGSDCVGVPNSEADSMIRAAVSIGFVNLASMNQFGVKRYMPRIEAPVIGSVTIGEMQNGVIWSGRLESPTNNPLNDFASVVELSIGCMSPFSSVWVRDLKSLTVSGSVEGKISTPELASDAIIRIGGRLGAPSGGSSSAECFAQFTSNDAFEDSPRNPDISFPFGQIKITEPGRLRGQVVINAANAIPVANDAWTGPVIVGSGLDAADPRRLVLGPSGVANRDDLIGPVYRAKPSVLGGGSVGVVRFDLHGSACSPAIRDAQTPNPVRKNLINWHAGQDPIRMAYYGPIQAGTQPVQVWYGEGDPLNPVDVADGLVTNVTARFAFSPSPGDPRVLLISPAPNVPIRNNSGSSVRVENFNYRTPMSASDPERYVVVPTSQLTSRTVSVLHTPPQPVASTPYEFRFTMNCNNNDLEDIVEMTQMMGLMGCLDCYSAAVNNGAGGQGSDGIIDFCQLPEVRDDGQPNFNSAGLWAFCTNSTCTGSCTSGYPGDFNGNGTRDVTDIFNYLSAWFAGKRCVITDYGRFNNPMGFPRGITADIFGFLSAWFGDCRCELNSQTPPRGCPCLVGANQNCQPPPGAPVPFDLCQ
ncbi:MAG: hypothetical protein K2Q20_13465 [Phycisphaerales bacterium]|nr:hypothetical protein [Phycisphaerales bacterium]